MVVNRRNFSVCALAAIAVPAAFSQNFPSRPLRWVVGYPPGSSLDVVARVVAEGMAKNLGQPVTVDNRTGAAGAIAANSMMTSPPDGLTLLSVDMGAYALNPHLYSKLTYQPTRDFRMVGMIVTIPMFFYVPADLGVNTVGEFVTWARAQPAGTVNFGSSGMGNPTHLTMEMFMRKAGVAMTHVPYRGSPPAMIDLMTGAIKAFTVGPADGMQHVKAGKLKVIGVAAPQRVAAYPEIPTLKEQGYDVFFPVWLAMAVAAATPRPLVDRINAALNDALRQPDIKTRLTELGFDVSGATQADAIDAMAKREYQDWARLLAPMNIKLD